MNLNGDSWEAHDPDSVVHPSAISLNEQLLKTPDFQNHFVIRKKPVIVDSIHPNYEPDVNLLKVDWESEKILNPHDSHTQPSNLSGERTNTSRYFNNILPAAGDGESDSTQISGELTNETANSIFPKSFHDADEHYRRTSFTPHVLPESECQQEKSTKVASLIAKFNQAAIVNSQKKNALPDAKTTRPRCFGNVTQTGGENMASTGDYHKKHSMLDGDKHHSVLLADVQLKYFPQTKNKPSNATSTLADSLVASLRPHLKLEEHKQQNHKHEKRKSSRSDKLMHPVLPELLPNKPLCPFVIDKQAKKNASSTHNLIFGEKKSAKPHIFGLLVSPYIDMSSFKDPPMSTRTSPRSGQLNMVNSASSPMDMKYPGIRSYVKTEKSDLNSLDDFDISLGASKKEVLRICEQKTLIPINCIFDEMQVLQKVGEGVFGEVFLGQFNAQRRVYKVVPIEGNERVNGEKQKTFSEIFPEILISKQLSDLSDTDAYHGHFTDGYIKLHNTRLAKGVYPEVLINTWKAWDERNSSDNDCPNFTEKQLYLIFEFDYGGKDAEAFVFKNSRQAFYLVLQIAHILAVGESAMEFEHRDLHWGNILVNICDAESASIPYIIDGKTVHVPSEGIKGCIIDFTIARVANGQKTPVFLDLKDDEEQFLGTGDHQFDIYRMMRDCNRNEWAPFCPKTNIYWIHYLADKLVSKGRYSETDSVEHHFFLKQLQTLKSVIMRHDSCQEFIFHKTCDNFKKVQLPRTSSRLFSANASKIKVQKSKSKGFGVGSRAQS